MFEAKLMEGNVLKKIVEAIKDVVTDVNIDVSPSGKCPADQILVYRSGPVNSDGAFLQIFRWLTFL